MNIVERMNASLRHRLRLPLAWVEQDLLGTKLRVRNGTLRDEVDKDDAWLVACACRAHSVVDVGANLGQAALLILRSASVDQIILVDANKSALSIAAENLIHNGFSHMARFVCGFASSADGEAVEFWASGVAAAGSRYRGHSHTAARLGASYRVPTLTLDSICEADRMIPDLVKVDTEGAEHEVLLGSSRIAAHQKTRFFVEMHSPPELPMVENAARVLTWCETVGYHAWYLADKIRLATPSQIQHRGRCHLLLQPASWDFPSWLSTIPQSAALRDGVDSTCVLR